MLLTFAHVLALFAGRCEAVLKDNAPAADATAERTGYSVSHPVIAGPCSDDTDGHDNCAGPDHSHVFRPETSPKMTSNASAAAHLVAPAAYAILSPLFALPQAEPALTARVDSRPLPLRPPPLAGRTANLLF